MYIIIFYLKCNYKVGLSMLLNSSLHCIVDLRCCGRNFKPSSKPSTVARPTPSATPNPRELTFIIYFTFTCMVDIDQFMKYILKGMALISCNATNYFESSFYEFFACSSSSYLNIMFQKMHQNVLDQFEHYPQICASIMLGNMTICLTTKDMLEKLNVTRLDNLKMKSADICKKIKVTQLQKIIPKRNLNISLLELSKLEKS